MVGCPLHDLACHLETDIRILRDARLVVGDGDHRGTVARHEREHALHLLVLAGDRVDERLALVDVEAGLERLDDRRVDRERHVGDRLHELDRVREDRGLVRERDAGVDVEHLGAGLDLRDRIGHHGVEVAGTHLLGELRAAGGVDPLPDDHERPVEADHHLARRRGQHRLAHSCSFPFVRTRRSRSSLV